MRKLQKELDSLNRELEKRASLPAPPKAAARPVTPPPAAPLKAAGAAPTPAPALPQDTEFKALRERLESLKLQLKERHNERNLLQRELKAAQAQIESLRQRPVVAASGPTAEEAEERLLETGDLQAKQPVRLPQFPHRFEEHLATLPPATARSCLATIGRLAGGEAAAFTGVKRLKALPHIYRQRISADYRLLFRLQPGRLEIVDLIHRRDLERTIKALA